MHIQVEGMNSDNFVMDYGDYGEVMFPLPTALGPGSILVRPIVATFFLRQREIWEGTWSFYLTPKIDQTYPTAHVYFFPSLKNGV